MELSEEIESYFILSKFLKTQNISDEKLGKLFSVILNKISFSDLAINLSKEHFEFCSVEKVKFGEDSVPFDKLKLEGCISGLTEDMIYNNLLEILILSISKRNV